MTKTSENKGFWSKLYKLLFSKEAIMIGIPVLPNNKPKNLSEEEFSAAYHHGQAHIETFFANLHYADGQKLYKALGMKARKVEEADKAFPTFLGLLKSLEESNLPPWEVHSLREYAFSQKKQAWLYYYNLRDRRRVAQAESKKA